MKTQRIKKIERELYKVTPIDINMINHINTLIDSYEATRTIADSALLNSQKAHRKIEALERRVGEAEGKVEWIKNEFLMSHDTEPLKPQNTEVLRERLAQFLVYFDEFSDPKKADQIADAILRLVKEEI